MLDTDASDTGLGVVLAQDQGGSGEGLGLRQQHLEQAREELLRHQTRAVGDSIRVAEIPALPGREAGAGAHRPCIPAVATGFQGTGGSAGPVVTDHHHLRPADRAPTGQAARQRRWLVTPTL